MGATSSTSNDGTGNFAVSGEGGTVSFADPVLTIDGGSYTISMGEGVTSTSQRIEVTGGATVTLDGVTIDDTTDGPAITISGSQDVTILLADESENVLKGKAGDSSTHDEGFPGIQKTDSASGWLIIGVSEDSKGTGKLEATGGFGAAGIGGGFGEIGSYITISGGVVTVTGGDYGAGIGGGLSSYGPSTGSDITISGGVVTATGGDSGAGIGGGSFATGRDVTISGGTVTATGGTLGAGIGGGAGRSGSNITITGGSITATGGDLGAGIGGGNTAAGSDITITGGSITATGGNYGAGIGGGNTAAGSDITISLGTVTANGGSDAAAIGGGGHGGSGSTGNSIGSDNVVIKAESGSTTKVALEGFGTIDKGLIFTKQGSSGSWNGIMYTSATIHGDFEIPCNLTIPAPHTLTVGANAALTLASGANLIVSDGAELANEGTISDATEASITNNGKITTKANFYLKETDEMPYTFQYQTYKTGDTGGTYANLPNPDNVKLLTSNLSGTKFLNWYYLNGSQKVPIEDGDAVLLNQHSFYENGIETYAINISKSTGGSIISNVKEAVENETVTITVTSEEGYHFKTGSLQVKAGDTEVVISEKEDNVYTFVMPASDVVISASFEFVPSPEPTPDPEPEPTPGTQDGWVQSDAGWQYVLNGEYLNDGWHYIIDQYGEHWYFFDADTYMATSRWIWDDAWEGWYWVCSTGPMIENLWQWIDNAWYGFWWGGKMCQGWV